MNRLAFKPRTATSYHARINRVLARISDDLDGPLGTGDLAGVANLSAFHFHRIFRAITGETVGGLVRRLRLERAGQALRRGEPLIEVALGAHYGSPEAFGRAFRDAFGLTPMAYRRAMPPPPQRPLLSLPILLDLNTLALSLEPLQGGTAMEVRIECFPDRLALCGRHTGPYNEAGRAFQRMYAWAHGAGILDDGTLLMGLSYDDPKTTPSDALRYDACLTVPAPVRNLPQGLRLDTVPGGRYAVHTLHGCYGGMHAAFERMLGRWLPASGEEIDDRPCIEI
jgi:AraC family transcriptional regulator